MRAKWVTMLHWRIRLVTDMIDLMSALWRRWFRSVVRSYMLLCLLLMMMIRRA